MNFITSIIMIIFLTSCATKQKPQGKTEAEVLYKEAISLVESGRYILATEKVNQIKSQFPYSFYATHAELLLADIFYLQENYIESAAAYILFKDAHPKHEKMPYVVWRIAESYFNQLPSTYDRDLSPGNEAIKYYEELLASFPQSEYIKEARKRIETVQEMKVKKDIYVADFYYKTDVFDSAFYRYLDVVNEHGQSHVREYAMLRAIESAYKANKYSECENYANQFKDSVGDKVKQELLDLIEDCQVGRNKEKEG